jgi:hypothetical protein
VFKGGIGAKTIEAFPKFRLAEITTHFIFFGPLDKA